MRQLRAPQGRQQAATDGPSLPGRVLVVLVKLDSALVSAADGTSASWYRRDRKLFRSLGWRSVILHARLRRQWPRLAAEYRAAAAEFASPARWRETFAASRDDLPGGP